jgi:hypothetical protein
LDVHEFDFWIQFQHFQHCAIGEAADEAVLNNLTEKYAYFGRERHAVGIMWYFYQCRDEDLELSNSAGGWGKESFIPAMS